MFPFERATTADDDLRVLAAYAAAEHELIRLRRQATTPAVRDMRDAMEPCEDVDFPVEPARVPGNVAPSVRQAPQEQRPSNSVWVTRLRAVEGVTRDLMVPIHGRLIAHGLLQFQLLGHSDGVVYRVTAEGRTVLANSDRGDDGDTEAA